MKRRIKQNIWGNWYGYEGTRRVIAFGNSAQYTAEQAATAWLTTGVPVKLPKGRTAKAKLLENAKGIGQPKTPQGRLRAGG